MLLPVRFRATLNNYRPNKDRIYKISIRVTLKRKSIYLSTGYEIEEKFWTDKPGEWVKLGYTFSGRCNDIIDRTIRELRDWVLTQESFGNPVTLEAIRAHHNLKGANNLFTDYATKWIEQVQNRKDNTVKLYKTFLRHIIAFQPTLQLKQINERLIFNFGEWLVEEKKLAGVSALKYFKPFRLICRQAVKDGLIEKDPFYGVTLTERIKPTRSRKRIHLEVEEIMQIQKAPLPESLQPVRTWFLFCFYAGFYYNDLRELRWQDIQETEYGPCIVAKRFKNDSEYVSPVYKFKPAIAILDEQRGKNPVLVFPDTVAEQKFNKRLKQLSELVGLGKAIMNKTARHSNIQFWKSRGMATAHVAKIVGHSSEVVTQQYFELNVRDVIEHVETIDTSIF